MSDSLEPPAKRARLEADAPIYGASASASASASALDAPGSPVDDLDDDFYDESPAKPSALLAMDGSASRFALSAPAPAPPAPLGFHLPGLGPSSEAPVTQAAVHHVVVAAAAAAAQEEPDDAALEDGELSDDDEAFYHDASAVAPPAANQEHALDHAAPPPPHGMLSSRLEPPSAEDTALTSAQDAAAADTDGELDAALTAAIELQNQSLAQEEDAAAAQASEAALIDSKLAFLRAAEANKDNKDAEWQLDSDASDSDASSSDSSSSDDDSDDGELLDPEEQVRLLMAEALDEEPGATGKAKVKTLNEVEEQYEKPDITVTEHTQITELGLVESVVENLVLIKAKTSGDEQVLESGSALCLQSGTVIGKISEQIGRVEEPRYALGFNDAAEIATLGIEKDTPIYYVNEHATFVLTEPLRYQKHTDASNLHDEETNDVEFSDDEKEAEYKREQKARKRARTEGNDDAAPSLSLPIPTGPRGHVDASVAYRSTEYQGGGLKYSDDEDEDLGMYKPLARPDHFEQIVGHGAPLEDRSHVRRGMGRGRGPWGDRGRGFRGRGGGGFPGRGDFNNAGQGNRGGFGGARGDFGAGRGDRGGHGNRGDRGGNNNRGDRGGRGPKGQADRGGRQQEPFQNRQQGQQKNGSQHDGQFAASASPGRQQQQQQQDRQGSQVQQGREQSQTQQSPPAGGKPKNRKQRQREKRERERLQQQGQGQQQHQQQQPKQQQQHQQQPPRQQHVSSQPVAPSNSNAYASNNQSGWPTSFSGPGQAVANYAPGPTPAPSSAAATYPYGAGPGFAAPVPGFIAPAPGFTPPVPPPAAGGQPQSNVAAWHQWFQLVGAMSQQQGPQPSAYTPPAMGQPQAAGQYSYPYQQPGQAGSGGNANAQGQGNGQGANSAQSLQDILRALGGGGAPQ